jgi:hypothetical protein
MFRHIFKHIPASQESTKKVTIRDKAYRAFSIKRNVGGFPGFIYKFAGEKSNHTRLADFIEANDERG